MARNSMMRRAFHQALIRHSAEKGGGTGRKPESGFIRNYILQYAKKNEVEISEEEVDRFILNHQKMTEN